jgi:nucleoid-associated protein YgaU
MLSLLQSAGPSYASVPRATAANASTVTPASFSQESSQPGHAIEITLTPAGTAADTRTSEEVAPPGIPQDTATVIEVERGDSPWSLAEAHLGDGLRWREFYEINRGLPQPDGRSWTNPELIVPGWQLRLPSAAHVPAPQSPIETTDAADVVHVVQRGDTLSSIADQYLGDPTRYPELFEANSDRIQPDGRRLTDPDLIVVGWNLVIPATQEPNEAEPVDAPAEPDQTTDVGETDDSPAATPTTTTPPPTTATPPAPSTTTPQPPPPTTAPAPAVTVPTPHTDTEAATSGNGGSPAPILVGLAGATALSTGLALRAARGRYPHFAQGADGSDIADRYHGRYVDWDVRWVPGDVSRIDARLSLGRTTFDRATASDVSGATGQLLWTWRPTAALRLETRLARERGQDSSALYFPGSGRYADFSRTTTSLGTAAYLQLTAKVQLVAGLAGAKRQLVDTRQDLAGATTLRTGDDRTRVASLGVRWQPLRTVTLGCDVTHEQRTHTGALSTDYHASTQGCHAQLVLN